MPLTSKSLLEASQNGLMSPRVLFLMLIFDLQIFWRIFMMYRLFLIQSSPPPFHRKLTDIWFTDYKGRACSAYWQGRWSSGEHRQSHLDYPKISVVSPDWNCNCNCLCWSFGGCCEQLLKCHQHTSLLHIIYCYALGHKLQWGRICSDICQQEETKNSITYILRGPIILNSDYFLTIQIS